MRIDVENAAGLGFECLPGCGFCCATSPVVLPSDEARARGGRLPVVTRADGTLGLAMRGPACAVLDGDRVCTGYDARPLACRAFPVQLHAFERLQADLHLGCPGLREGLGADARELARRVADEAVAGRALNLEAASVNAEAMRERLDLMGHGEAQDEVVAAFHGLDATDPDTLRGFYAAASDSDLSPEDVEDAVEAGRASRGTSLKKLLLEVAAETPRRTPDHVEHSGFGWKPLDLTRADPAKALGIAPNTRAPLAAHLARLRRRDLTWGHALHLVDATGYAVSPSAAVARVLADAAAGLLLRAEALGRVERAISSYEWHYWGLPTVGAGL